MINYIQEQKYLSINILNNYIPCMLKQKNFYCSAKESFALEKYIKNQNLQLLGTEITQFLQYVTQTQLFTYYFKHIYISKKYCFYTYFDSRYYIEIQCLFLNFFGKFYSFQPPTIFQAAIHAVYRLVINIILINFVTLNTLKKYSCVRYNFFRNWTQWRAITCYNINKII